LGIQHPQFCERVAHLHASQDAPPKFDHGCWEKSPLVHKRAPSRRNAASVPERRLPQHAGPSDFLGSVLSWRHTADDARPVRAALVHDSAAADLHSRIVIFENFIDLIKFTRQIILHPWPIGHGSPGRDRSKSRKPFLPLSACAACTESILPSFLSTL
jgi:hypothetical protein